MTALPPFVLVHGAFHGAWCWKSVSSLLRRSGHEVYTPTLTGLGERAHLAQPGITLETHIADVCQVIECEELSNVILVGHSYAAYVTAGVADRLQSKIARLIYLDSFLPVSGTEFFSNVPPDQLQQVLANLAEVYLVPAFSPEVFGALPVESEEWHDQPEILLALVGDGKDKPALVQRASEAVLANVQFLQPVPKVEMPQALAAVDACIAILKPLEMYKTVYPNKVFDYMAAGRPVILAIDGVIRQVVENAPGGLFMPPGDASALVRAILYLADDPQQARLMGLNARSYVEEHFDRAILARHLVEICEQMVGK